ncbi:hypothetical protein HPB48_015810 [Haemaphysalis longicornis]|uniref:SWIM-type domain-containing protein n=1 Tax=Haemaphysalis longicornis TaxID=44386 RepID=A0A9J6FX49_HAELO|nr:hypothetical protein HPB48_015810 [Haemaphysalis longicornis]
MTPPWKKSCRLGRSHARDSPSLTKEFEFGVMATARSPLSPRAADASPAEARALTTEETPRATKEAHLRCIGMPTQGASPPSHSLPQDSLPLTTTFVPAEVRRQVTRHRRTSSIDCARSLELLLAGCRISWPAMHAPLSCCKLGAGDLSLSALYHRPPRPPWLRLATTVQALKRSTALSTPMQTTRWSAWTLRRQKNAAEIPPTVREKNKSTPRIELVTFQQWTQGRRPMRAPPSPSADQTSDAPQGVKMSQAAQIGKTRKARSRSHVSSPAHYRPLATSTRQVAMGASARELPQRPAASSNGAPATSPSGAELANELVRFARRAAELRDRAAAASALLAEEEDGDAAHGTGPVVAIRSSCYRSWKKNADPYTVHLAFRSNCDIEQAQCSCPAGVSGYCSHLMAVLRTVVHLQNLGYKETPEQLSPTERPQQWRRPRKTMAPQGVMNVNLRRIEGGLPMTQLQCSTQDFVPPALTEQQKRESMMRLSESTNEANGCWAAILADSATARLVKTQCGPSFEGSAKDVQMPLLPCGYEGLVPWQETPSREELGSAPVHRYLPNEQSWWPPEELGNSELLQGLVLSTEDASVLELNTRQQARSPTWKAARANRLTASKFHAVLNRKQPWTERGIANVMRPKAFSNSIVRHGTTNEPRAIQRYVHVMEHLGRSVVVSTCGLMVRPSCPWLGETPDRVVYDPREDPPFGLIKVKCPWSKRADPLSTALASEDFCMQLNDGIPELKVSSEYYAQVMGQMFCSGFKWTHFVMLRSGLLFARLCFQSPPG